MFCRLDKGVSGVLLQSRGAKAAEGVRAKIAAHEVSKVYVARVEGALHHYLHQIRGFFACQQYRNLHACSLMLHNEDFCFANAIAVEARCSEREAAHLQASFQRA